MAKGTRDRDSFTLGEPGEGTGGATDGNGGVEIDNSNDGGSNRQTIDPEATRNASGTGNNTPGDTPKKRGRPAGSKNAGKANDPQAVGRIYGFIMGLHMSLALKTPEMAITEAEANLLAKAIADVLLYYPTIRVYLEGKAAAHLALAMAAIQIYGTRLVAIQLRLKKERDAQPTPGNVHVFTPGQPYTPKA